MLQMSRFIWYYSLLELILVSHISINLMLPVPDSGMEMHMTLRSAIAGLLRRYSDVSLRGR